MIARRQSPDSTAVTTNRVETQVDDARLIECAKAGDQAAFEMLVQRYERQIYALAYRTLGNTEDACDVTQEAFIRAYRNLARTSDDLYFSAWLHRIVTNACFDLIRRRRVRWQPWDTASHEHLLESDPFGDPERVAIGGEHRTDVQRVLAAMHPRHRLALLLREYEGLSTREIGEAMGITVSAVKSLLFRARNEFRRIYEQQIMNR